MSSKGQKSRVGDISVPLENLGQSQKKHRDVGEAGDTYKHKAVAGRGRESVLLGLYLLEETFLGEKKKRLIQREGAAYSPSRKGGGMIPK